MLPIIEHHLREHFFAHPGVKKAMTLWLFQAIACARRFQDTSRSQGEAQGAKSDFRTSLPALRSSLFGDTPFREAISHRDGTPDRLKQP